MSLSFSSLEFLHILNTSPSIKRDGLIIHYLYKNSPRIGFSVSVQYGGAVKRNLFKRRCRYLFREVFVKHDISIAMIIRPVQSNISFSQIKNVFINIKGIVNV